MSERLEVFVVTERPDANSSTGQKSFWTRVGVAWPMKNGTGYTVNLDALPANGKLVMMPPKDDDQRGGGRGGGYGDRDRAQGQQGGKRGYPDPSKSREPNPDDDLPF